MQLLGRESVSRTSTESLCGREGPEGSRGVTVGVEKVLSHDPGGRGFLLEVTSSYTLEPSNSTLSTTLLYHPYEILKGSGRPRETYEWTRV